MHCCRFYLLIYQYFAFSGLRTNLVTLDSAASWLAVILVILAASSGKILGVMVATHMTDKFTFRESLAIGVLMNTKGWVKRGFEIYISRRLVELIVLNIGLDTGVLDTKLFTVMVIMALITTLSTTPLVLWICPQCRQSTVFNYDAANAISCGRWRHSLRWVWGIAHSERTRANEKLRRDARKVQLLDHSSSRLPGSFLKWSSAWAFLRLSLILPIFQEKTGGSVDWTDDVIHLDICKSL